MRYERRFDSFHFYTIRTRNGLGVTLAMRQENGMKKLKILKLRLFNSDQDRERKLSVLSALPAVVSSWLPFLSCGKVMLLCVAFCIPLFSRVPQKTTREKGKAPECSVVHLTTNSSTHLHSVCHHLWPLTIWTQQLLFRSPEMHLESWKSFPRDLFWVYRDKFFSNLSKRCQILALSCGVFLTKATILITGSVYLRSDLVIEVSRPSDKTHKKLVLPENYFWGAI